jgi:hypothetical protein
MTDLGTRLRLTGVRALPAAPRPVSVSRRIRLVGVRHDGSLTRRRPILQIVIPSRNTFAHNLCATPSVEILPSERMVVRAAHPLGNDNGASPGRDPGPFNNGRA